MFDSELLEAARTVRNHAYAPYSGYKVGAAIRDGQGRVFVGCNVENISYGGTICAERHAIGAMVAAGGTSMTALAVATLDGGAPCGLCLQSIAEFAASDLPIALVDQAGEVMTGILGEFLPRSFASHAVARAPE